MEMLADGQKHCLSTERDIIGNRYIMVYNGFPNKRGIPYINTKNVEIGHQWSLSGRKLIIWGWGNNRNALLVKLYLVHVFVPVGPKRLLKRWKKFFLAYFDSENDFTHHMKKKQAPRICLQRGYSEKFHTWRSFFLARNGQVVGPQLY